MSANKKKTKGTGIPRGVPRSISNMELAHPANQGPESVPVPNTAREAVVEGPRQPQRRKVSTKSSIIYFCPLCKQTNIAIESHLDDCLQKLSKNTTLKDSFKPKITPLFHPLNPIFTAPPAIPDIEKSISEDSQGTPTHKELLENDREIVDNIVGECPFCKKLENLSNHLTSCLVFSSEIKFKPIKRPPQFYEIPKFHKCPLEDNKPEFWHVATSLVDPNVEKANTNTKSNSPTKALNQSVSQISPRSPRTPLNSTTSRSFTQSSGKPIEDPGPSNPKTLDKRRTWTTSDPIPSDLGSSKDRPKKRGKKRDKGTPFNLPIYSETSASINTPDNTVLKIPINISAPSNASLSEKFKELDATFPPFDTIAPTNKVIIVCLENLFLCRITNDGRVVADGDNAASKDCQFTIKRKDGRTGCKFKSELNGKYLFNEYFSQVNDCLIRNKKKQYHCLYFSKATEEVTIAIGQERSLFRVLKLNE